MQRKTACPLYPPEADIDTQSSLLLTPARLATSAHFAMSSFMKAANFLRSIANRLKRLRRQQRPGLRRLKYLHNLRVQLLYDRGRRAGRCKNAVPACVSKPGKPFSAIVGTSGATADLVLLVTARSSRSIPAFTFGSAETGSLNADGSPARR